MNWRVILGPTKLPPAGHRPYFDSDSGWTSRESAIRRAGENAHHGSTGYFVIPEEKLAMAGDEDGDGLSYFSLAFSLASNLEYRVSDELYLKARDLILELSNAEVATLSPARPKRPPPQVCPEIWAKPIPGMDYMAAVRAMCGDGG